MDIAAIIGLSCALLLIILTPFFNAWTKKKKLKERLRRSWGKRPQETYKHEDLESIASFFVNHRKEQTAGFAVDDITWRDLDMDDLFIRLNNTETTAGEETLYKLLRELSFDLEVLKSRHRMIEFFRDHQAERETVQTILARLGKIRLINVTDYFFQAAPSRQWKVTAYRWLAAIALIISPIVFFFQMWAGIVLFIVSLATNIFVYYNRKFDIIAGRAALSYIIQMVHCVKRLIDADLASPDLRALKNELQSHYRKIRKIGKRKLYLYFANAGMFLDVMLEYVKIVLLKELIDHEYLCNATWKHRKELIAAYETIGLLDSLISIASFRESLPFYCQPDLQKRQPGSMQCLEFEEIYHPMVDNPIVNSLAIGGPVLVTGSNASGKSTFLKTVAINAILAQSFHTCLARKYASSTFAVFTSMALRDSTRNGESYFVVEIKSIKRILDYLNGESPCLCLIDEVLRGTNTIERIAASSQVLMQLAKENCICLAATHDTELTFILENYYRNVHFQEAIADDKIVFDYKLRDGRASSRNAIKLLQLMGYNAEIVDEAEKRADNFIKHGNWKEIPE